jgi:hypothetical protein
MICIKLPQANINLNPAQGDEETVYPITGVITNFGIVTAWQLEPHEILELGKTGVVYVTQSAGMFNPMRVDGTNPFGASPFPEENKSGIITEK